MPIVPRPIRPTVSSASFTCFMASLQGAGGAAVPGAVPRGHLIQATWARGPGARPGPRWGSVVGLEPGLGPAEVGLAPRVLDRRDGGDRQGAVAADVVGDELAAADRDHDVAGAAGEEGETTG